MGNEETLSGFPIKQVVPALVSAAVMSAILSINIVTDPFAQTGAQF